MKHISEWQAKTYLAMLLGIVLGCVTTVWDPKGVGDF